MLIYLYLAVVTGLRRRELCWLEWADVREKEAGSGKVVVWGKTDAEEKSVPKSHKQRHIPLSKTAVLAFKKYRLSQPSGSRWILPVRAAKWLVSPSKAVRMVFRRAWVFKRGNLLHILRHTAATGWLAGGADLATVKNLLGHADISTTQIYLHTTEARKREAVERAGLSFPSESVKVSVKVVPLA